MRRIWFAVVVVVSFGFAWGGVAAWGQERPDPIDAREILATARFLASDTLGGREVGSPEGRVAALYIASRFEALGIEPVGGSYLEPLEVGQNVVARLPGGDPERVGEVMIVGAHYDHLGRGEKGVYNGADDNASGVAVLLAVAKALALGPRPDRSVVFIAFDGEEKGLGGSRGYCGDPAVPLEKTAFMVNLDMVGRDFVDLFPKFLFAVGTENSPAVRKVMRSQNEGGPGFRMLEFSASLVDRFWASSDHKPFWEAKVPFVFLSTSMHRDYHSPSDDADRLKPEKMAKIASLVTEVIRAVGSAAERPVYRASKEILTAEDRKGVEAILAPAVGMGPMLGLGPEEMTRLGEILSLVRQEDHEWTEEEVDSICTELRTLLKGVVRK